MTWKQSIVATIFAVSLFFNVVAYATLTAEHHYNKIMQIDKENRGEEMIEIREVEFKANKCYSCGSEKDIKDLMIGSKRNSRATTLCTRCRAELQQILMNDKTEEELNND